MIHLGARHAGLRMPLQEGIQFPHRILIYQHIIIQAPDIFVSLFQRMAYSTVKSAAPPQVLPILQQLHLLSKPCPDTFRGAVRRSVVHNNNIKIPENRLRHALDALRHIILLIIITDNRRYLLHFVSPIFP